MLTRDHFHLSVSVCSELARKLFMLGSWAFVAASHAKRRSGSHGRMVFVPCCTGCGGRRLT